MEMVSVVSAVLGIVGALIGVVGWFAGAVKKTYAAEREFMHLKNLINQGYSGLDNDVEQLTDRIERMELLLIEINQKIETLVIRKLKTED